MRRPAMDRGREILCCFALAAIACGSEPARNRYAPAELKAHEAQPGAIANPLRARVWADQDHRRQRIEWSARLKRTIDRANLLLEPDLGIAIEVVDARPWERKEPIGDDMELALRELEATDPGADVDLVIGLVSALPIYTPDVH